MTHETKGKSDEWFTPKYVFDALGCNFDMDVACPKDLTHIKTPAGLFISENSLQIDWSGFIWMNPPFGDKDNKIDWLNKFFNHGNGIALTPDRTCTDWWHYAFDRSGAVLFPKGRVNFIKPDGTKGDGAGTNSCLWASGKKAFKVLRDAEKKGFGRVGMCASDKLEYSLL